MKKKAESHIKMHWVGILIFIVSMYCFMFPILSNTEEAKIRLRFNLNYVGDTITKQKTGLAWALSFLGASMPKNCFEKCLIHRGENIYELNLHGLGFSKTAIRALKKIIQELKSSEEYNVKGGIDLGEFVVFTLGSSWHYYAITGAAADFEEFKKRFGNEYTTVFPVLNSEVARHHRLIKISANKNILKTSFIAEEGIGDLEKGTFKANTYEVFDIMENGQLRFAVYGEDGKLKAASDRDLSTAGKPTKCLWCHEINILPLFTKTDALQGYLSPDEFQNIISLSNKTLNDYRRKLISEIDFTHKQDHALMELLYVTFMQPTVIKLANEWGENEAQLQSKFKYFERHDHHEYSFLKNMLIRTSIKSLSPYKTVLLPDSVWEENKNEPNIFEARK